MVAQRAGIWIDGQRALVIRLDLDECPVCEIPSGTLPRGSLHQGAGTVTRSGRQGIARERSSQARRERQQQQYYRRILAQLEDVEQVLVLGPDLTRYRLGQELGRKGLDITGMQASGPLSADQLEARVRDHFAQWDQHPPSPLGQGAFRPPHPAQRR